MLLVVGRTYHFFSTRVIGLIFLLLSAHLGAISAQTNQVPGRGLTVQEVVKRVVEFNESVQMKMLEAEISRKTLRAEKGIFEPAIVGSVDHIDSQRPNNVQEARSLL